MPEVWQILKFLKEDENLIFMGDWKSVVGNDRK